MGAMKAAGERLAVRMRALGQPWELAVFLWLPFLLFAVVLAADLHFRGRRSATGRSSVPPLTSALHGHSPYHGSGSRRRSPTTTVSSTRRSPRSSSPRSRCFRTLAGRVLVLLLTLACVLLALRLLGVRDWRCYGLALLTAPVLDTVSLGALSSAMLLGVAAAWRYRDRPYVAAPVTALTAVAKLFAWPLFVWLLATRRVRTAFAAAAVAVVLLVGGWAAIDFAGLHGYPHLLRVLSRVEAVQSYSLVGLFRLDGGGGDGPHGAARGRGRRRGGVRGARPGRRSPLAVGRGRRGAHSRRRCSGSTTSSCCSCRSRSRGRASRPSGSRRSRSGSRRSRTRTAASGGRASPSRSRLLIVLRSLAPAASAAAARRPGLAAPRRVLPAP